MASNKLIVGAVAGLAFFGLVIFTAINERALRSPSALLQKGGNFQKLYGYGYGYPYGGYPNGYGYDGYYPYGYGGYGYPDYYDGYYQQYVQQQYYNDYIDQQRYADYANQNAYYNWVNSQYKGKPEQVLRVANGKNGQQLVYMGDFEFNGYKKEITGGNDGGFNAPFDLNGDGQEVDNWAKVSTQWKHKKGAAQLAQANIQQLAQSADPNWVQRFSWYHGNKKPWAWFKNPPGLPKKGQVLPGGRVVS
eukprot:CAMPEP_0113677756 /NCGR_PEP_ID=MMETSP0038_2-20120614/9480_1 /TAXON_ID=2898 /ORGANISM="Cryptomonas paramecium" /LENGTH=247 /DNA_ID=CAMNT_0000595141 /DNA_START=9 /DNA_END=752 /DNA_ORIENTATION=+ /assembly_acc=CAM_ASM_000170